MDDAKLKNYWSRELRWGWSPQSRLVFEFLRSAANFVGEGAVLDAGAGHQRYRPFFCRAAYISQEHPAGIEFKKMQGMRFDIVAPIDERIPLRDSCLDGVISTSVIEHLRFPERFLVESMRVLKPGGKIFINVPFAYPEHEVPFDFQRPTRYALQRWLSDAGFVSVSVKPSSSSTATVLSFLRSSFGQDALGSRAALFKTAKWSTTLDWARRSPIQLFVRLALIGLAMPAILTLEFLGRFFDRGPTEATTFPTGWLCVAAKAGLHEPQAVSKESFLSSCIEC